MVLARKAEVKPLLTPETDYFEMVSSPEKMASSPEKKVPSPDKMIPSSEEKVSLPQSSSHCLKPMSCGDGPYYCVVLPRKSEANPLVTPETDHFEVVSSPEKMASSSTEEMVSSPEKVVSAPEKITSAPEKQTWW